MSKEITQKQKEILDFIIDSRVKLGNIPTLAEIANYFGYKNRSTIREQLESLEKKGYIKRNARLARGIEVTIEDKFFVPRPILGEVAAGNPLTIYPDSIDTIDLPTIVKMPKDSFLLKVKGDSLKDAYIFSGDIVIVNPNIEPANGHIVAAILDDAAVVKRFIKTNDGVELHSENAEYAPIMVDKSYPRFKIVGVVIGIYRSMDKKAC
ncbi:MAG: transcriptional repressor LexA [bacterium]